MKEFPDLFPKDRPVMNQTTTPQIDLSSVWQPDPARRSRLARLRGLVRLSGKQLRHRFLESLLIVLGIAVGVGVLTGTESVVRFLVKLDTELLLSIPSFRAVTARPRTLDLSELYGVDGGVPALRLSGALLDPITLTTEDLIAAKSEVPAIGQASAGRSGASSSLISAVDGQPVALQPDQADQGTTAPLRLYVELYTPDDLAFQNRELVAGRNMTWEEYVEGSPVLLLEEESAALLFPDLPVQEVVGRTVTAARLPAAGVSGGVEWRIVGVLAKVEPTFLGVIDFTSSSENEARGYGPHTTGASEPVPLSELNFLPAEGVTVEELVAELDLFFAQRHGEEYVALVNPTESLRALTQNTRTVTLTLMGLASLALLVASLNILNLFTARVIRRRRVSAMSVALGAERRSLFGRIMTEALLLGVGGSLLGLLLAHGITVLIKGFFMSQMGAVELGQSPFAGLGLSWANVAIGLAAGAGASCLFGIYPAYLNASMNPADGLRTE